MEAIVRICVAVMLFALASLAASPAEALVFTLNCQEDGSNNCTAGPSFGTITILDNLIDATTVDVTIDLTGVGRTFRDLLLNFNPAFDNTGWTVNGLTTGFTADEDNISLPPLNGFNFDFEPTTAVNVSEPQTFTIARTATNLNPSDFDFTATFGSLSLFAGVHIQNCGPAGPAACDPTTAGENSTKVFAVSVPDPVSVPKRASVALLGPGLLGLALVTGVRALRRRS
jgi:hypothetical protein